MKGFAAAATLFLLVTTTTSLKMTTVVSIGECEKMCEACRLTDMQCGKFCPGVGGTAGGGGGAVGTSTQDCTLYTGRENEMCVMLNNAKAR